LTAEIQVLFFLFQLGNSSLFTTWQCVHFHDSALFSI